MLPIEYLSCLTYDLFKLPIVWVTGATDATGGNWLVEIHSRDLVVAVFNGVEWTEFTTIGDDVEEAIDWIWTQCK